MTLTSIQGGENCSRVNVPELYRKALDLERDLHEKEHALENESKHDPKTSQLVENQIKIARIKLCEVLDDIILHDPKFAVENNAIEKLWKNCFYHRIAKIRARKMKAQQKVDHQYHRNQKLPQDSQQQLSKRQESGEGRTDVSKYVKLISHYTEILNHDLYEGVHMYLYVCKILQTKFLHIAKPAIPSLGTLQVNGTNTYVKSLPETSDGIVECLRRLYINVGDCYRYAEDEEKAKTMYTYSSRLGPGVGHAYNQLAVLSQQKKIETNPSTSRKGKIPDKTNVEASPSAPLETTHLVTALYWYCRALLASHQPFPTATMNLERLFIENRRQLPQPPRPNTDTSPDDNGIFFTNFVDMHYDMYLLVLDPSSKLSDDLKPDWSCIRQNMNKKMDQSMQQTLAGLERLLHMTALSDYMLCQLVSIQAFTIQQASRKYMMLTAENAGIPLELKVAMDYSIRSTIRFGECLGQRVLTTLTKRVQQIISSADQKKGSNPGSKPIMFPSVRLLLPFMMVTEYLFHLTNQGHLDSDYLQELDSLWNIIVKILNQLNQLSVAFGLRNARDDNDKEHLSILREYISLRGYAPFQPFLQELPSDGNIEDGEAVVLFDVGENPSSSSTNHNAGSKGTIGGANVNIGSKPTNEQQSRCKVTRFLSLGRAMAVCNKINITFHSENDTFLWTPTETVDAEETAGDVHHSPPDIIDLCSTNEDIQDKFDAGENKFDIKTLSDQQDCFGGSPLLVPSVLMLQNLPSTKSLNAPRGTVRNNVIATDNGIARSPQLVENMMTTRNSLSSGNQLIAPPPGFGMSMPSPPQQATSNQFMDAHTFVGSSAVETRVLQQSMVPNYPVGFMESNFHNLQSFANPELFMGNTYGHNHVIAGNSHLPGMPQVYETRNPFIEPTNPHQLWNTTSTSLAAPEAIGNLPSQQSRPFTAWNHVVGINDTFWKKDMVSKSSDTNLLHSIFSHEDESRDQLQHP